jgi:hypothetical protein
LVRIVKKMANEKLKDVNDDAEAIKKNCVNQLVWATMGGLKKAFLMWHKEA